MNSYIYVRQYYDMLMKIRMTQPTGIYPFRLGYTNIFQISPNFGKVSIQGYHKSAAVAILEKKTIKKS